MQRRTTKRTWLFCGYFLAIGGGLTIYELRVYLQLAIAHRIWPILVIVAIAILFQGSLGIALDRYLVFVGHARRDMRRRG